MVTPEEARQQILEQRAKLKQAQQRLIAVKPPEPTRAELERRGLEQLRRRKLEAEQRRQITQAQRGVAVTQQQFEREVARIEPQITAVEEQRAAIQQQRLFLEGVERGKKLLGRGGGVSFTRLPSDVKREAERQFVGEQMFTAASLQVAQLKNLGLNPIFSKGRLTGFEDAVLQQSINLENLTIARPEVLPQLERLGFIENIKQPQIDISQIAFKDIITGELISARKPPTPTFKPIVIDPQGREIRDVSIFEQASLNILPEIKERTLLEEIKFRGLITTGLRKLGGVAERFVGEQRVAPEDVPRGLQRVTFVPPTKEEEREIIEAKTEVSKQTARTIAEISPFFIPIVGAGLLIGSGLERIVTKGGQAELQELGLKLEQIGIPRAAAVLLPAAEILGGTALLTAELSSLVKLRKLQKGVKEPTTTIISAKQREKLKEALLERLSPDAKIFIQRNKLTSTRAYETVVGNRVIRFIEFGKAGGVKDIFTGKRVFYALEIDKATGKVKSLIGGLTIEKTAGSSTTALTKLLRISKQKKFFIPKTKKELITLVEKSRVEILARQKGITISQARTEIKLLERKEIKTLGQLFLEKEKSKKAIQEAFAKAKELGKAETITINIVKKGKFTLEQLEGKVFGNIITRNIRSSEIGKQIFRPAQSIIKLGKKKPTLNLDNILKLLRENGIKVTNKVKNLISKGLKTKQITKLEDVQISRIVTSGVLPTATSPALAQIIIAEQQSIIASTKGILPLVTGLVAGIPKAIPSMIKVKPPKVITKVTPALIETQKVKEKLKTGLLAKSKSKLIQPTSLKQITRVGLIEKTALGLKPRLRTGLTQRQQLRQKLRTTLQQRQRPITRPTTPARVRFPPFKPAFVPPDILAARKRRAKARALAKRKVRIAYFPLIKEFGKFKKLTKFPLSLKHAKALAGFTVDRTLSAQFKLKKIINPKKVIKIRPPKFPKDKFRAFRRRGRKRIPLENFGHIERRKFRLDTKNEAQTIQQFKRRKAFKGLFKKPKRKKK